MNLRIIHSDFELNLVDSSFTMVEENNWFGDQLFTKYTYPISRELNDEEEVALNYLTSHLADGADTVFDVLFYVMDQEHRAVMEIEKMVGRKIEFQIRYGFEDFPNFEKKLAQLPLHKFDLEGESIYDHALDRIDKTAAEVDYNFPRVFCDLFDTESPQWEYYQGSVNNYDGIVFLMNEYDEGDDVQINRNIMQPLPSLLYVLRAGFADKGYTLAGDILTDPDFKDAWIYSLSKFYSAINSDEGQVIMVKSDEYHSVDLEYYYNFEKTVVITEPGRYKIAGNLYLKPPWELFRLAAATFELENSAGTVEIARWDVSGTDESFLLVDVNFTVLVSEVPSTLKFLATAANYRIVGGQRIYDSVILDVTLSILTKLNPDGSAQPTLLQPKVIDLTQCVPDITFGDLFKAIRTWKNYGVEIVGTTVYVNLVHENLGKGKIIDLTHKEVAAPERTANKGKSFELKFSEVSSDDYEYPSLYIERKGVAQMPYVTHPDTEEIIIEALPLPLKTEHSITTAHGFLDDDQRLQLVLYSGLNGDWLNLTNDPRSLMLTAVYESYYRKWMAFLLNTIGYRWEFIDFDINLADLHSKSTVFAYGRNHTVVSLHKKNIGSGIINIEIETYSLE